jgi:hypothetical protein
MVDVRLGTPPKLTVTIAFRAIIGFICLGEDVLDGHATCFRPGWTAEHV